MKKLFQNKEYDIVVNFAAEKRMDKKPSVYKAQIFDLSRFCGYYASKLKSLKRFIEISTSFVYKGNSKKSKEDSVLKP